MFNSLQNTETSNASTLIDLAFPTCGTWFVNGFILMYLNMSILYNKEKYVLQLNKWNFTVQLIHKYKRA